MLLGEQTEKKKLKMKKLKMIKNMYKKNFENINLLLRKTKKFKIE